MEEILYFALLDNNNVVINAVSSPRYTKDVEGNTIIFDSSQLISVFPDAVSIQQYSQDDVSITNNPGSIGHTYDSTLNAFIPPKPNETYILNTEDFNWYPDPNLEYELNGDGIMSKWIPGDGWKIV